MVCKYCGNDMHLRGARKRLVRGKNGIKIFIRVDQYWCPKCNKWARELPKDILPFKQYPKSVMELEDDDRYIDGPSESTRARWRKL